jgi:Zn-dependent protease with chaperone function
MHFASCPEVSRQALRTFSTRSLMFLLATLLAPISFAGTSHRPDAPPPATESATKDAVPIKDPKKLEKYDIEHIGQRGIGHGFNIYSLKREHELGENLAAALDHTTKIITDPVVNDYVNRVAQRLIRYSDAEIPFTVKVIDYGDIPRAYGLPGGFLYVDSALILSADSEAELAAIMAHEIGHVAARHATRALTRKELCHIVDYVAYIAGPAGAGFADVGGLAGPLSVKKFARDSEYEADLLGIEYAYAAGYDPQALLDALEKLHALEEQKKAAMAKIPGYHFYTSMPFHSRIARGFANYPLTEERIERLQSEIVTFLPTLRRHPAGEDNKGPVLRRTGDDVTDSPAPSSLAEIPYRPGVSAAVVATPPAKDPQ